MPAIRILVLAALFAAPTLAHALKPPITFGTSGPWTKIADAVNTNDPTFGPGHNIAASGNEIYVVYSSDDRTLHGEGQIWLAYSLDGGATFRGTRLVARGPNVHWNGAQVAIGPDPTTPGGRRLHVVWGNDVINSSGDILHSYAALDPVLGPFSSPRIVSGGLVAATYAKAIAADPTGGVHIVFAAGPGLSYTRSADGGETFAEVATSIGGGGDPCIATDAAGDVFVLGAGVGGMFYRRRLASEGAFSPEVDVPGIAADEWSCGAYDADHVYASGIAGGVAVASTANGGQRPSDWSVTTVWAGATYGEIKPLATGGAGVVAVAWQRWDGQRAIYFSRSVDGGAVWSVPVVAAAFGPTDNVRDPNLTIDASGKALIDVFRDGEIVFTKEK